MLIDWLQSDRLHRRVVTGLALGLAVMYLAWMIGYVLLPEGVLRGKTGAGFVSGVLPADASVFLLALIWNSAIAFVVMPLVGLLAVGRLSLGYVLGLGNFALYGIFLGTNSFSNPRPEALPRVCTSSAPPAPGRSARTCLSPRRWPRATASARNTGSAEARPASRAKTRS